LGNHGFALISFKDFERLLREDGEACIAFEVEGYAMRRLVAAVLVTTAVILLAQLFVGCAQLKPVVVYGCMGCKALISSGVCTMMTGRCNSEIECPALSSRRSRRSELE